MEHASKGNITLVDVLERVLDKGVVVDADLVISIAGIPLVGVNLRAAVAGMETMTKYGVMEEWDKEIRATEEPCPG
ncbi:gas vesicle protein [Geotalea uraniireducens]|uniref:Gas vesicle protein GVPa n=1 Tax=Geotalea uraniireducens (strain Rf4) TaxID=351605 RepID=A5G5D0_GEOUR|nr:gas vesicle protein [Geotalea uraniireducens]ABQ26998.1 gas vesicle protein GVPa [Geotalea uraniireducens Rf4]